MNKKEEFIVVHAALTDVFIPFSLSLLVFILGPVPGVKEISKKEADHCRLVGG